MLHLAAMREVTGIGKCGHHFAMFVQTRVPAAVVEVEMRVDDDVHIFKSDAGGGEALRRSCFASKTARSFSGSLLPMPGFDNDGVLTGTDNDGVEAKLDAVLRIRGCTLLPHGLGHHTEHGSAVEIIGAIGEDGQLEIAERGAGANQIVRVQHY